MKRNLSFLMLFTFCCVTVAFSKGRLAHPADGQRVIDVKKEGFDFVENKGQWVNEAKFKADIPGGALFITDNGFVFNYAHVDDLKRMHTCAEGEHEGHEHNEVTDDKIRYHAYKVIFQGANSNVSYLSKEKRSYYHNYFLGNDPSKWAGNTFVYGNVSQQNLYNGIDLNIYSKGSALKYDLIVAPNASVNQIKLNYEGVNPKLNADGSLLIKTSVNEVTESAPYCYQIINGEKVTVESRYKLTNGIVTFDFPNGYDVSKELIIDPVLVFSTYSGGSNSSNYSYTTSYDDFGNLYAGAECWSTGWPLTLGAFQGTFGGIRDVGINKYNAAGSALIYSTYYGGSNYDLPHAMKVNANDELVLVGSTSSNNIPTTANSYDATLGGQSDMYVVHFNATGTAIIGSSYLGGSANEPVQFTMAGFAEVFTGGGGVPVNQSSVSSPMELTFDTLGNIWIVGNTRSTDNDIIALTSVNTYTRYVNICQNSTYTFGSQVLSVSGIYEETFPSSVTGCDSLVKLHLTVGAPITKEIFENICPGTSYLFNNVPLSQNGTYTQSFTSAQGCDSVVTLHLNVLPYKTGSKSVSICSGQTFTFGSQLLTAAGVYTDTFSTSGCDSIATLNLSIQPSIQNEISVTVCGGETYLLGSNLLTASGTYSYTFPTLNCDSIVTLNLTVLPLEHDTLYATFCGSSYNFFGSILTSAGIYTDTLNVGLDCKRIVTLSLTSSTSNMYNTYVAICSGSSYTFGGNVYATAGVYTDTFSTDGCDSIVTLHLSIRPAVTKTVTDYFCAGGNYTFGNQTLTAPGIYTHTFSTNDCDSTVTLNLAINQVVHDTIDVVICQGTSYDFGGNTLLNSGYYTHVFTSQYGCDSIVTLHLGFNPYISTNITGTICAGGSYVFDNQNLTSPGTYIATYPTSGCDSVVVLTLTPSQGADTVTFIENYCPGSNYYFGSQVLTANGVYYNSYTSSTGCDSVVRLVLTGSWNNADVQSGGVDVIVYQLDPACSNLMYSAYLGGTGEESPTGLIFNNEGNLIISGITNSTNFPTTAGSLHPTSRGGYDGFVTILNPTYGTMVQSTYVGTTSTDHAVAVQVDEDDNIYVLGRTLGNYPISPSVWVGNVTGDVFVDKLDPYLTTSLLSTRVGNNQSAGRYFPSAFLIDICGNIYVCGFSSSQGAPLTSDAYQTNHASFWFGVMQPDFAGLLFGSYFGASTSDHNHIGINRLDPNGIVYHSICNASQTFSGNTSNSWSQNKQTSGQDILSFKFNFEATGVQSNFILAANQNDTGCVPFTVEVENTSVAATNYFWDFGDGSPIVSGTNPTHIYTTPGTYTIRLHANNPNTCITDDTSYLEVVVLKTEKPELLVHDTVVCDVAQNIDLTVEILNPSSNNIISWGPANGINGPTNTSSVNVNPAISPYYVTVKDTIPGICGFSTTDTIHIDLAPRILSLANNDTIVCDGAIIQIIANGTNAYDYKWSPAIGVSDSTIINPTITATQPQLYTLTGSYYACPDTAVTLYIDVHKIPTLALEAPVAICEGEEVAVTSSVTPFRNDYVYSWTPVTPNMSSSNGANMSFIADTTITYHLKVATPIGCSDEDSVKIIVHPGGFGEIIADTGYCPGNELQLWARGGSQYSWSPTYGLSNANIANPVANPGTTTDYTVIITNEFNCSDTEHVNIQVYPAAILELQDSIVIYPGERYHIQPGTNASYFSWFPPSGVSNTNIADPLLSPEVRTRYFLTAKTEFGCTLLDSIDVIVKETIIDIPNAFAPNGSNNVFKPSIRGIAQLKEFSIYNRWGNKVYSGNNVNEGWDGTFNGVPQPMGVYIYVIDAITDSGHPLNKKGNVTLVR